MLISSFFKKNALLLLSVLISGYLLLTAFHLLIANQPTQRHHSQKPNNNDQQQHKNQPLPITKSTALFGEYLAANNTNEIPSTLLSLSLVGIIKATNKQHSQALIKIDDEQEKTYFVDQEITQGTRLIRILNHAVLLKHNGKIEKLSLPKHNLNMNAKQPALSFGEH